jgi:hypothetical protein
MNDLEPDDVDEFAHFFSLGPLAFEMEFASRDWRRLSMYTATPQTA